MPLPPRNRRQWALAPLLVTLFAPMGAAAQPQIRTPDQACLPGQPSLTVEVSGFVNDNGTVRAQLYGPGGARFLDEAAGEAAWTHAGNLRQLPDGQRIADMFHHMGLHLGDWRGAVGGHCQEGTELRLAALALGHHHQSFCDGQCDLWTVILRHQGERQVQPAPQHESPVPSPKAMRCVASAASTRRKPSLRVPSVPMPKRMPRLFIMAAGATALPFHCEATGL